jgi:hypothetical protein
MDYQESDSDIRTVLALLFDKPTLLKLSYVEHRENRNTLVVHKMLGNRGDSGLSTDDRLGVNIYFDQDGKYTAGFSIWNTWENINRNNMLHAIRSDFIVDKTLSSKYTRSRIGSLAI